MALGDHGTSGRGGEGDRDWIRAAGVLVKDAVDKTREKVAEYRDTGIGQVSQDVVGYTRSQPVTALLIATGVGMFLGMLLALGRR